MHPHGQLMNEVAQQTFLGACLQLEIIKQSQTCRNCTAVTDQSTTRTLFCLTFQVLRTSGGFLQTLPTFRRDMPKLHTCYFSPFASLNDIWLHPLNNQLIPQKCAFTKADTPTESNQVYKIGQSYLTTVTNN